MHSCTHAAYVAGSVCCMHAKSKPVLMHIASILHTSNRMCANCTHTHTYYTHIASCAHFAHVPNFFAYYANLHIIIMQNVTAQKQIAHMMYICQDLGPPEDRPCTTKPALCIQQCIQHYVYTHTQCKLTVNPTQAGRPQGLMVNAGSWSPRG